MSSDNKDPRELLKASFSIVDRSLVDKDYKSTLSYPLEEQNVYRFFYQLTRIARDKGAIKHDDRLDALSGAVGYWLKAMGRNVEIAKREHRRDLLEKKLKRHIENAQGRPIQRKTCVVHS